MNQHERAIAQQWAEKIQKLEAENERLSSLVEFADRIIDAKNAEIERLQAAYDSRGGEMDTMRMVLAETQKWNEDRLAEIKQLQSLLFRIRNYIAGEHTLDRPKDAMLELIDAALKDPKP